MKFSRITCRNVKTHASIKTSIKPQTVWRLRDVFAKRALSGTTTPTNAFRPARAWTREVQSSALTTSSTQIAMLAVHELVWTEMLWSGVDVGADVPAELVTFAVTSTSSAFQSIFVKVRNFFQSKIFSSTFIFYSGCPAGYVFSQVTRRCELNCKQCQQDEIYKTCGSPCEATCDNPNKSNVVCTQACREGCFCDNGFVRNQRSGLCILPKNCPNSSKKQ